MKAELVMVGTELLLGETIDTNSAYISQLLGQLGIDIYYKSTVGDNWLRMIEILSQALSRSDLVITSGGLGPTMDDITREVVAAVTNNKLSLNQTALTNIEDYFNKTKRHMTVNNHKQAYLPEGAICIENNWGTAPGIISVLANGKIIICLPGVPRELKGMMNQTVIPYLTKKTHNRRLLSRTLRFVGIGESQLEAEIKDILTKQTNPTIAPYPSLGEVKLRITAKAETEEQATELILPVEQQLINLLKPYYYGADEDTLESIVAAKLCERNETLVTAESCTGGLIAHRLTNIPGSSEYFERGFITYSNQSKIELLGVNPRLIATVGAVSKEVAQAMASGARQLSNATWGLSVTGIAGPGGGTKAKPVGLVHMCLVGNGHTISEVHRFQGSREEIKFRVSQAALNLLRINMN